MQDRQDHDSLFCLPEVHGIWKRVRQRPNNPPARHGRSVLSLTQFVAEALADDVPALAGVGIRLVILQAFIENLAMPFGHGYLLGSRCDSVPQRLHVLDLLVDREVIDPGGGSGTGLAIPNLTQSSPV